MPLPSFFFQVERRAEFSTESYGVLDFPLMDNDGAGSTLPTAAPRPIVGGAPPVTWQAAAVPPAAAAATGGDRYLPTAGTGEKDPTVF
jgi:alkanesulfonate monooxygenase SsuD/methylene tetrahydromethanopterin reductase-like flavin-dependent oxidoreductase (luciferase family)